MEPSYLIVGNWKMNPSRAAAESLAIRMAEAMKDIWLEVHESALIDMSERELADMHKRELVICPPFPLLDSVGGKIKGTGIMLGAQDCHTEKAGAYTGDVSALLLRDMGCTHVIVGHSERRTKHKENNAKVRAKAKAALDAGLVAIICVGESASERKAKKALDAVKKQLHGSLPKGATAATVVVAYEPVWAIGTGETPPLEEIEDMHTHIREVLEREGVKNSELVRIIYGGSVDRSNARGILYKDNVNGVLVGGASLSAEDFIEIAKSKPTANDRRTMVMVEPDGTVISRREIGSDPTQA